MSSTVDFIEFVCEQVRNTGIVRYKKMFGDYMVYINDKPMLLVCDNIVFIKILPCLDKLMIEAEKGYPYNRAKEHYILDIENSELTEKIIAELLPMASVPKPKKKKLI